MNNLINVYLISLHTGTDLIVQRFVGIILVFWTGTSPHFSTILVVQVSSGTSLATFSITSVHEVFFSSRQTFSLMSPHSIVGIMVVTVFLKARVRSYEDKPSPQCLPNILTNLLSYIFRRLDWNCDVGALHLRNWLALLLVYLKQEN